MVKSYSKIKQNKTLRQLHTFSIKKKWTKYFNRYFSNDDIQMAIKDMKICLVKLVFQKMKMKITTRYHFIYSRKVKILSVKWLEYSVCIPEKICVEIKCRQKKITVVMGRIQFEQTIQNTGMFGTRELRKTTILVKKK